MKAIGLLALFMLCACSVEKKNSIPNSAWYMEKPAKPSTNLHIVEEIFGGNSGYIVVRDSKRNVDCYVVHSMDGVAMFCFKDEVNNKPESH